MRDILQMSWRRAPLALALGLILAGCADSGGADRLTSPGHQDDLGTPAEPTPLPPEVTDGTGVGADADPANIVVNGSFEAGNTDWLIQGDTVKLSLSSESKTGTASLFVEGRLATWNSPVQFLPDLIPGRTYAVSAWLKLPNGDTSGETPLASFTVSQTVGAGSSETTSYFTAATRPINAEGWTELAGSFTAPATTPGTGYKVYFDLPDADVAYLVDDILIKLAPVSGAGGGVTPNLAPNSGFEVDTSGWYASGGDGSGGGALLTRTSEVALEGTHSVRISNRTANWNAPNALLQSLTAAGDYVFSMGVRLPEGTAETTARLTLKIPANQEQGTEDQYLTLAEGPASSERWTILRGLRTYPGGLEGASVYIELTQNATTDYFVDALQITQLSGNRNLIPGGSAEANIDSWSRMGDENVVIERSQDARYLGQYGVKVSERGASWHGPSVSLLSLPPTGTYHVSAWMRMAPEAAATTAKFTVKIAAEGAEDQYLQLTPELVPVGPDGWVELAGDLPYPAGTVTELLLYVETSSGTDDFYIDELTVTADGQVSSPLTYPTPVPYTYGGLAVGRDKFLGSAVQSTIPEDFHLYWNQVTPENSAKWGEVEVTRNTMDWQALDTAYTYAKANQIPFKLHTLVWGSQYPEWLTGLSPTEQREEVEQWIAELAARYPETDSIDVVNEALKANALPPFRDALSTDGEFGWVVWAFERARLYFPKARLLINDYGIVNDGNERARYKQLINLLVARNLVDGIGLQGHYFNLDELTGIELQAALDDLEEIGLPIYITELDISAQPEGAPDGTDDEELQSQRYQELFPVLWDHPAVAGVTVWNYIWGETWRHSEAVTALTDQNGDPRAALEWLRQYFSLESAE